MKRRDQRPVLITDAELSPEQQLRIREVRYIVMMGIRALSVVAAAVVVTLQLPLLWLWLTLCAFGMIVVPWLAVVLANDRLPKQQHRWRRYRHNVRNRQLSASPPPSEIEGGAGRESAGDRHESEQQ